MDMDKIKLPFWMANGHLKKYSDFLTAWFVLVKDWVTYPLNSFDIDTTSIRIVDLFAWERDITRFNAEPEWLYRKRVKFAYQNARDAGSLAGFKAIWARMELGALEIHEHVPGREWDIIQMEVEDKTLADNPELLNIMIAKYGLACRRYEWFSQYVLKMNVRAQHFGNTEQNLIAKL
jgi:hypothetical protein